MLLIKYRLINIFGLIVSFLPAVIATYQYYPAIVDVTSSFFGQWLAHLQVGAS